MNDHRRDPTGHPDLPKFTDEPLTLLELLAGADEPTCTPYPPTNQEAGSIDKRCILRDQIWVDVRGHVHPLEDLTPAYRANVINYLRRTTPNWVVEAGAWLYLDEVAGRIDSAESARRHLLLRTAPPDWLEASPLLRRLRALVGDSNTQPLGAGGY
ncbi:hypothetical protein [Nocardioides sp. P86]|uniref:hypothetical protein n=1 Tax=Nocardioides sp. P86 TaxID=2939569 RepID=UPI00203CD96B|nr:hypothetical protein [Nocardioides sp. P86]MCM3516243.1 hypothetical protein [Nocardioides sp. P86]